MEAKVLTWTRLERPPAGFQPGRVLVLVEAAGERHYALWEGQGEPRLDGPATLERRAAGWVAR